MFFLCNALSSRRKFLTRLALACAGAVMLPTAILNNKRVFAGDEPNIGPNQFRLDSCIGRKQRDVMLACQWAAQAMGVLRGSTNITHYSPDHREVLMDWTMILPPEDKITPDMEKLAYYIKKHVPAQPPPWGGQGWGG